jgi:hypothetical protein
MEGEIACPDTLLTRRETDVVEEPRSQVDFFAAAAAAQKKKSDKAHERAKRAEHMPNIADGVGAAEEGVKRPKTKKDPLAEKLLAKWKRKGDERGGFFKATSDAHRLHCQLCGWDIATKSDTIKDHVNSKKHKEKMEEAAQEEKTQPRLNELEALKRAREEAARQSERNMRAKEHRRRVLVMLLEHGIPPGRLYGDLKELLEEAREYRISLGYPEDLVRDHLPVVIAGHDAVLRAGLKGNYVSFFADASPRFAEAFVVGFRWIEDDFTIRQEVADFQLFDQPLTGNDYTGLVMKAFETVGIPRDHVIAGLTDRAATNGILAQNLRPVLPRYIHSFCMAHAMDSLCKVFSCGTMDKFFIGWNKTFGKSGAARRIFRDLTGENFVRKHKIRWGSLFDQVVQVFRVYGKIGAIVSAVQKAGYSPKGAAKLAEAVQGNLSNESTLAMELAVFRDVGVRFREANLLFQGDGFLAPFVYDKILSINAMFHGIGDGRAAQELPNVAAIITAARNPNKDLMWTEAKAILEPAYTKYNNLFNKGAKDGEAKVSLMPTMQLFRVAQLFHPRFCQTWINRKEKPLNLAEAMKLEDLRRLLGAQLCDEMVAEFPSLLVLYANLKEATNLNPGELLTFWSRNARHVPAWICAARIFCLLQPSSAAAERAFSIWRTSVGDQQVVTLEDRQKVTMQIKFSNTISPEK